MGKVLDPRIAEKIVTIDYRVLYNQTQTVTEVDEKGEIVSQKTVYFHLITYVYNIFDPDGNFLLISEPKKHISESTDAEEDFFTADAKIDILKKQWFEKDNEDITGN